jgi:hypothetical protein
VQHNLRGLVKRYARDRLIGNARHFAGRLSVARYCCTIAPVTLATERGAY